jgi:hypothetical protein
VRRVRRRKLLVASRRRPLASQVSVMGSVNPVRRKKAAMMPKVMAVRVARSTTRSRRSLWLNFLKRLNMILFSEAVGKVIVFTVVVSIYLCRGMCNPGERTMTPTQVSWRGHRLGRSVLTCRGRSGSWYCTGDREGEP